MLKTMDMLLAMAYTLLAATLVVRVAPQKLTQVGVAVQQLMIAAILVIILMNHVAIRHLMKLDVLAEHILAATGAVAAEHVVLLALILIRILSPHQAVTLLIAPIVLTRAIAPIVLIAPIAVYQVVAPLARVKLLLAGLTKIL